MSAFDACLDVVLPLVRAYRSEDALAEPSFYFWSEPTCQGAQYPADTEFPVWDQYLPLAELPMNQVQSLYVPHHAALEAYSENDGYFTVEGPAVVPLTRAHLKFWHHADDSDCAEADTECGTPVVWSWSHHAEARNIHRLRVVRRVPWTQELHDRAVHGIPLTLGSRTLLSETDYDNLFQRLCGDEASETVASRFRCHCHWAHEELKRQVPDEMEHAFVDASHTTCNPNQHFVPSTAKVSRGTRQECLRLFRAKMRSRAFLALDEGGPSHVVCNGITFENADRLGITPDETPFAEEDFPSTEDRTNRRAELYSQANERPNLLPFVLVLALLAGFVVCFVLYQVLVVLPSQTFISRHKGGSQARSPTQPV